jgi:hypothetical protein
LGQTHKLWGLCKLTHSFKLCLLCFFLNLFMEKRINMKNNLK